MSKKSTQVYSDNVFLEEDNVSDRVISGASIMPLLPGLPNSLIQRETSILNLNKGLSILKGQNTISNELNKLDKKKPETHLLYRIFEELDSVKENQDDIALWHIIDEADLDNVSTGMESLQISINSNECVSTTTKPIRSSSIRSISFRDLNQQANQISRVLRQTLKDNGSNIGSETLRDSKILLNSSICSFERSKIIDELAELQQKTILAIFMPPGVDRVVIQLACMKLHLAYLPLDRQLPANKIIEIIEAVRPISVIIDSNYFENADDLLVGFAQDNVNVPDNKNLSSIFGRKKKTGLCSHLRGDVISRAKLMQLFSEFGLLFYDCLLSVAKGLNISCNNLGLSPVDSKGYIYTECLFPLVSDPMLLLLFSSGTTSSQQKGVKLSHRQMYNRLKWQWDSQTIGPCGNANSFDLSKNSFEVVLCKTAWLFIDSFTELFSMILVGLPCVVCGNSETPSEGVAADVYRLAQLCFQFQITRVNVVPAQLKSWLCQIEAADGLEKNVIMNQLCSLTTFVCSGDILTPQLARKFFAVFNNIENDTDKILVNLYGSTEVAGDVSFCVYRSLDDVNRMTTSDLDGNSAQSYLSIGEPISNVEIYIVSPLAEQSTPRTFKSNESLIEAIQDPNSKDCSYSKVRGVKLCAKDQIGEIAVAGLAICQNFYTYWGQKLEDGYIAPSSRLSIVLSSPKPNRPDRFSFSNVKRDSSRKSSILNFYNTNQRSSFVFNNIRLSKPELSQLYLTGDRGFISSRDNKLYIVGRSDDLVKVNGVLCNASWVDLLIAEVSTKSEEFKSIETSKTLGIKVPGDKNRLVCFYTLKNSSRSGDSAHRMRSDSDSEERVLGLPIGRSSENTFQSALLAELINNHLSVYITPVFIQLDHMPYQRVSGKVDQSRLRMFYLSRICNLASEHLKSERTTQFFRNRLSQIRRDSATIGMMKRFRPKSVSVDMFPSVSLIQDQESNLSRRECARKILSGVLGVKKRLNDDEDFYVLGGDSLAVVEAVCELRRADFPASVHLFATTGRIGDLLSNLEHKLCVINENQYDFDKQATFSGRNRISFKKRSDDGSSRTTTHSIVNVSDWLTESDNPKALTKNQLVTYVTECFKKRDRITKAFNLSKNVLQTVINTYIESHLKQPGLILVATSEDISKPLGVVIALPSNQMPIIPVAESSWESFEALLELCISSEHQSTENELFILMLAANSLNENLAYEQDFGESGRLVMETLATLERAVISQATTMGFTSIATINTNPVTQAICAELGYLEKNSISLKEYSKGNLSRVMIAPEHYDVTCHFMTKRLDSQD